MLLGGEAGLRCGEMIALEWSDVDLAKRQLCVQRSDWNGQVTTTKGGRLRYVPLTVRLTAALREHRHLREPRVLCQADGTPFTRQQVQYRVKRAAQTGERAGRRAHPSSHVLLAPGDAWRASAGDSGTRRTQRARHDAALHAPESRGARRGDSTARSAVATLWQRRRRKSVKSRNA